MNVLFVVAAIPIGLVLGGFVTMLVDRIPDKTPLGPSRCPHCEARLSLGGQLPLISWALLRGRCRSCGDAITPAYPVVEIVTAALVVAVAARFGFGWEALPPLILAVALIALSTIDIYTYRLPDRLVFPSWGVSAVAIVVSALALDRPGAIVRALVGSTAFFVVMLIFHLVSPRGMGFGDVKLALLLGLHVGWAAGSVWTGWTPVVQALFWALMLGCVFGLIMGAMVAVGRRVSGRDIVADPEAVDGQPSALRKQSFPFGPGLAMGTMVVVLLIESIIS